jgi:hypothetical protein
MTQTESAIGSRGDGVRFRGNVVPTAGWLFRRFRGIAAPTAVGRSDVPAETLRRLLVGRSDVSAETLSRRLVGHSDVSAETCATTRPP